MSESQARERGGTSDRAMREKRKGRVRERMSSRGDTIREARIPERSKAAPYPVAGLV